MRRTKVVSVSRLVRLASSGLSTRPAPPFWRSFQVVLVVVVRVRVRFPF